MRWQPGQTIADLEKIAIVEALGFFEYNKTKTAQALGISIRTIDNKLIEYKLGIENGKLVEVTKQPEAVPVVAPPPPKKPHEGNRAKANP